MQRPSQRRLSNRFGSVCLAYAIVPVTQINHDLPLLSSRMTYLRMPCATGGHIVPLDPRHGWATWSRQPILTETLEQVHLALNALGLCSCQLVSLDSFLSEQWQWQHHLPYKSLVRVVIRRFVQTVSIQGPAGNSCLSSTEACHLLELPMKGLQEGSHKEDQEWELLFFFQDF